MSDSSPIVEGGGGLLGWFRRHEVATTLLGVVALPVIITGGVLARAGWRNGSGREMDPSFDPATGIELVDGDCVYKGEHVPMFAPSSEWNTTACAFLQKDVNTGNIRAVGLVQNVEYQRSGKAVLREVSPFVRDFDVKIELKVDGKVVATFDVAPEATNNRAYTTEWVNLAGMDGEVTASLTGRVLDNAGRWHDIQAESDGTDLVVVRENGSTAMYRGDLASPVNLGIDPAEQVGMGLSFG